MRPPKLPPPNSHHREWNVNSIPGLIVAGLKLAVHLTLPNGVSCRGYPDLERESIMGRRKSPRTPSQEPETPFGDLEGRGAFVGK